VSVLNSGPVLLIGADGQLGTELRAALAARGITSVDSSRDGTLPQGDSARPCDLTVPGAVAALISDVRPALVLNAAAYTAVDRAESDEALAQRLNAEAVGEIGAAAKRCGAKVVHYSTDYVFAGDANRAYREDDAPAPQSAYGRTKLDGERALAASSAESLTFRLAWVYAGHSQNFLLTMLRVAAERDELRVVADQIGAPTPAHWIADATLRALDAGLSGLYHLTPQGQISWHGYAEAIFEGAVSRGLLARSPRLLAVTTADYPTPARRPAWSVLDSGRLDCDAGIRLPEWRQGLDEVLDQVAGKKD